MTEARCKQLMEELGMPHSRSLMFAIYQVANETEQEVRATFPPPEELAAMERLYDAAGWAIIALSEELGHNALMANFGELVLAFDALRAIREGKP